MEEWKPIKGYEGIYEISNHGNVRELEHKVKLWGTHTRRNFARMKKTTISKIGYRVVNLFKDGKVKLCYVHRLVADAFIEQDESRKYINHKDGDKTNNHVENLERCTQSENTTHSYRVLKSNKAKPVRCIETGVVYDSLAEAGRSLGSKSKSKADYIRQCAEKKKDTAYGYHWEYIKTEVYHGK